MAGVRSVEDQFRPLADRMRPLVADQIIGQDHLLGEGKPLRLSIDQRHLHSMVLWGPPGTGKTTLARVAANRADSEFLTFSAVLGGVADIRKAVASALDFQRQGRSTVLFVDEVHRFNKAQQDAFLPHLESGLLTLIGATTENPSFEINNALLSRVKVYVLRALLEDDLRAIIAAALADSDRGLGNESLAVDEQALALFCAAADGDARRALNLLELAAGLAQDGSIDRATAETACGSTMRRFDKGGDVFYEQISALHKSVRSSNPDAALYWFCRMLDGGCDPLYVARRVLRMASEDLGNADPRAMQLCLDAWQAFERLGSPEGELAIAQAICYLACAPKSNAVYAAFASARQEVRNSGSLEVPLHLRNAPTRLMKQLGHGRDYRYDHDQAEGIAFEQRCFPDALGEPVYYQPVDRGLELKIKQRLDHIRKARSA
jgi:putative ATPase